MNQKTLEIKNLLLAAQKLLNKGVVESDNGYCSSVFESYLESNQLLLAMEELDGVIEDNPSPDKEFWVYLKKAAEIMEHNHQEKYESIIKLVDLH